MVVVVEVRGCSGGGIIRDVDVKGRMCSGCGGGRGRGCDGNYGDGDGDGVSGELRWPQ